MRKVKIKPLSVNDAWRGRQFKTPTYKTYELMVGLALKKLKLPPLPPPPYEIHFEFGFSSKLSDWDNPIKPTQDIICKHYGIDDKHIFKGTVIKKHVKSGEDYFKFEIKEYKP